MITRGIALALALLLLAAGASAAPGPCCPSSGPAEQTIRSLDCCAAMLECPAAQQAALTTTVRSAPALPTESLLPADIATFAPDFPRPTAARAAVGTFAGGPPLYRPYAQLLI